MLFQSSLCPRNVMIERVFRDGYIPLEASVNAVTKSICMLKFENDLQVLMQMNMHSEESAYLF